MESHDSMHRYFIRLLKAWQIALINEFHCVIFIPKDDDEENNLSRYIYFTWKNEANLFYYKKSYYSIKNNILRYFVNAEIAKTILIW